jgi:hypothetical protein
LSCPRCGHELSERARFCEQCGARVALSCSACGAESLPGSRYCTQCGAPVRAPTAADTRFASPGQYTPKYLADKIRMTRTASEGERKLVTVLFADIKSSMEFIADRDPEHARAILDPVIQRMMQALHEYEGTVNHVLGDGIMALVGAPIGEVCLRQGDAPRAVPPLERATSSAALTCPCGGRPSPRISDWPTR